MKVWRTEIMMQNCFLYERRKIRKISYLFLYCLCAVLLKNSIGFWTSTKQFYELSQPSVCPSVTPFSQWLYHLIITTFSEVFTIGAGDDHAKGHGQWSSTSNMSKYIFAPIWTFPAVSPIWIHSWLQNDALRLKERFFYVIHNTSRSHGQKINHLVPIWGRLFGRSQLSNLLN